MDNPLSFQLLADAVLLLHFGVVVFVVGGLADARANDEAAGWRRRKKRNAVLPEVLAAEATTVPPVAGQDAAGVLPDVWRGQPPMVIGLIAQMTGCVLPEDIAVVANRLVARGQALMGRTQHENRQTNPLDRSP